MNRDQVISRLQEILQREFDLPVEQCRPDATLRGTLGMHSLQLVSLAVLIEEAFPEVRTSGADFDSYVELESLGEIADFIAAKIAEATAAKS